MYARNGTWEEVIDVRRVEGNLLADGWSLRRLIFQVLTRRYFWIWLTKPFHLSIAAISSNRFPMIPCRCLSYPNSRRLFLI